MCFPDRVWGFVYPKQWWATKPFSLQQTIFSAIIQSLSVEMLRHFYFTFCVDFSRPVPRALVVDSPFSGLCTGGKILAGMGNKVRVGLRAGKE